MDPVNDEPKLRDLLKEWQLPGAPPSLDARVLRKIWWKLFLTGSVRIPVPLAIATVTIILVMAFALMQQHSAPSSGASFNLADFQPVRNLNVRMIRGHHDSK